MTISTANKKTFHLVTEDNLVIAGLIYTANTFDTGRLEIAHNDRYLLHAIATGTWVTYSGDGTGKKIQSRMRVQTGGVITVRLIGKRVKYLFKKSGGWKLRFSLTNKDGEDLLTIIPSVNWQKEAHDYILQLNEEFEKECDPFLILQAVHCANCSLSMMTGGKVPPLVSI